MNTAVSSSKFKFAHLTLKKMSYFYTRPKLEAILIARITDIYVCAVFTGKLGYHD